MAADSASDPASMLPLTPAAFQILLALVDTERHGYSIMQEVARYADGAARIGPTTLYRSIRHLLDAGLIEAVAERPDPALEDERRRYYRLTALGRRVVAAETARLEHLLAVAHAKQREARPAPRPAMGEA